MSTAEGSTSRADRTNVHSQIERTIQRNIKGLEFLTSSPPAVGLTPKDLIHARGIVRLYRYKPVVEEVYRVPLLLIMATTNKGYIFDLEPGQSLVEFLLTKGYDVYLLDWNAPRPEEKRLRLENYVLEFIPDAIARVQLESGERDVTIVGYCQGGVLSVMYAALHADGPLKNLACLTTAIDWHQMGLFSKWSDKTTFDVDRLVDAVGNVPQDFIVTAFDMLKPASRTAGQLQVWERMWDDKYVRSYRLFDKWANDVIPVAGEYFRQLTKELMWENRLYKGELMLSGQKVDLRQIKVPILHAVAEHDHIVPYGAAKPLIEQVGSSDKEELMLKGGHVSLVAGPNAVKRLWPKLDAWLSERST
jgi:polyhydroxyalkanoate synthase subunit PhaC